MYNNCCMQISELKEGENWRRRDITIGDRGESFTLKLRNEHSEANIRVGQRMLISNASISHYKTTTSINSTPMTYEHTEANITVGQRVLISNLSVHHFKSSTSVNSTSMTSFEVCNTLKLFWFSAYASVKSTSNKVGRRLCLNWCWFVDIFVFCLSVSKITSRVHNGLLFVTLCM